MLDTWNNHNIRIIIILYTYTRKLTVSNYLSIYLASTFLLQTTLRVLAHHFTSSGCSHVHHWSELFWKARPKKLLCQFISAEEGSSCIRMNANNDTRIIITRRGTLQLSVNFIVYLRGQILLQPGQYLHRFCEIPQRPGNLCCSVALS